MRRQFIFTELRRFVGGGEIGRKARRWGALLLLCAWCESELGVGTIRAQGAAPTASTVAKTNPAVGAGRSDPAEAPANAALLPLEASTTGFMTSFYDVSLGISTAFLLLTLYWSVSLRRKLQEHAARIRQQVAREARLEERYRQLFENAHDVVCAVDPEGRILSLNQTGERIIGSSRQSVTGLNFKEFLSPSSHEIYDQWLANCQPGKSAVRCEVETIVRGGETSILELSGRALVREGCPPQIDVIARDTTERKRAEQALKESEERFASAFRVSPVAIALCTRADERFLSVNASFLNLFQYALPEVLGRTAQDLQIWENPQDVHKLREALESQHRVAGLECRFRTKQGAPRIALVFIEPIDVGRVPCVLFISYDMTERLNLEAQLRQALKMEAIGRLAAGVAHDFNNLLVVIQGNAEVALMKADLDPEQRNRCDRIADAARRAANLIRQLLTFGRQQVVQPRPLSLNELTTNLTKMVKHLMNEDMVLKFAFGSGVPAIEADPTMMEQVLMNLAVNARDAMPSGGCLTIGTAVHETDATYVSTRPEARIGRFVRLTVSDTGCGMDAATLARVFEPFFTTKEAGKGSGLGLATVYGIVKQHHGWIDVSSTPGQGTTFNIFFPCAAAGVQVEKKRSVKIPGNKPAVLVVEDEADVGELVRSILQDNGFRTFEANSALKAMEVWSEHADEIDLVVTDVRMPKGMSGYELAHNLWALRPDLKLIFTSGYSVEAGLHNIDLQEGVSFLAKPYPPTRLLEVVRRRLAAPEPALAA